MKKQRFQVGDKVTYKDKYELPNKRYCYNGTNQKGYVGTITSYKSFIEAHNCYKIQVSTYITNADFYMLESEFVEYDVVQEEHEFKVGDVVTTHKFVNGPVNFIDNLMLVYDGKKGNISDINEETCTVYVHRYWWPFSAIKLASEEPSSKFNIGEVVNVNNEGYEYTGMDRLTHNSDYTWETITHCNVRSWSKSNIVVKDKVYSSIQDKWWYKFDECGNWTSECGISPITLVVSPMVDILVEAIRKYPIGTKYIPLTASGEKYVSEYKVQYTPIIRGDDAIEGGIGYLYAQGEWAEVVPETKSVFKSPPTIATNSWGFSDSSALSPLSPKTTSFINPLPEPIQNTMPDEDIVHRENTIKAMQL